MIHSISHATPVAKKDYPCNASEWVYESLMYVKFTFSEKRDIVKAKRNGWKVKKGEKYIRQFNTEGGDTWAYIAIPAMDELCQKYDLFPER
jgi:hypothetical protein